MTTGRINQITIFVPPFKKKRNHLGCTHPQKLSGRRRQAPPTKCGRGSTEQNRGWGSGGRRERTTEPRGGPARLRWLSPPRTPCCYVSVDSNREVAEFPAHHEGRASESRPAVRKSAPSVKVTALAISCALARMSYSLQRLVYSPTAAIHRSSACFFLPPTERKKEKHCKNVFFFVFLAR